MRLLLAPTALTLTGLVETSAVSLHTAGNTLVPSIHDTTSSIKRTIVRRFTDLDEASDEDFSKIANKGGALMCAIEGSNQTAGRQINDKHNPPSGASVFTGDLTQAMRDWYWNEAIPRAHSCEFDTFWQMPAAFGALGLSTKSTSLGGDNVCYKAVQWDPNRTGPDGNRVPVVSQWYENGGKQYQATGAEHEFAINTKGGGG